MIEIIIGFFVVVLFFVIGAGVVLFCIWCGTVDDSDFGDAP